MSNPEMVTIPIAEYLNLVERDRFLSRLEEAGVDNWEWYHLAFRDENADDDSDDIEDEPLSFEEWRCVVNIEAKYEKFYDEYGDSAGAQWDYEKYHYDQYVTEFNKYP